MTYYKINPVPKPRQTQRDKWAKRPSVVRYREFADKVRGLGIVVLPEAEITFYVPMPKSWPKFQRGIMDKQPHKSRPDIDNYLKALLDALFDDDSHIWSVTVSKFWAYEGGIEIKNKEYA